MLRPTVHLQRHFQSPQSRARSLLSTLYHSTRTQITTHTSIYRNTAQSALAIWMKKEMSIYLTFTHIQECPRT